MKKKWTSSEIAILLASNGKQFPKIEGRSKQSIRQKLLKLKIKCVSKFPNWTKEEIEILKKAKKNTIPCIKGRTKAATRNKMTELGLRVAKKFKEWTPEQLAIIKNHNGKIPNVPGKTPSAVRTKMKSMGIIIPNRKYWSKSEIDTLKNLFELKKKIIIPGRSSRAIQKKLHELKLIRNPLWSKEEIAILKKTGNVEGRSNYAIRQMKLRLGLVKPSKIIKKWSKQEELKLIKLYNSGLSAKKLYELEKFPGHSRMSIQRKLCRIGLKRKKVMPEYVLLKLNKFLLENWKGKTPDELLNLWNLNNPKYTVGKRRISKCLDILKIKISSHEVQKMNNLKKKEEQIISGNISSPSSVMEQIRAQRVKMMRSRLEQNKDMWTGLHSMEKIDFELEEKENLIA